MQLYWSLHWCCRNVRRVKRQPESFAPIVLTRMGWSSLLLMIHLVAYSLRRLIWLLWRFIRPARKAFLDCRAMSAGYLRPRRPSAPCTYTCAWVVALVAVLPKRQRKAADQ